MKYKQIILVLSCMMVLLPALAEPINTPVSQMAKDAVVQYGKKYDMSAMSITLQCSAYHLGLPETAFAGTMGLDDQRPLTRDSVFQIGSITKSFVAVVLIELASDKKYNFSLDDTVGKWFGDTYPNWKEIKVRNLLNMTSRIPNYTDSTEFVQPIIQHPYKFVSAQYILNFEKNKPLDNPINPDTGKPTLYEYSNTNYILAGELIHKITGNTAHAEIQKRILDKLGLRHTRFVDHLPEEAVPANFLVDGYAHDLSGYKSPTEISRWTLSWGGTAGAMLSSTADINRYARALFTPTAPDALLTSEQFDELTTLSLVSTKTGKPISDVTEDDNDAYGLGISKSLYHGVKYYTYIGGTLGFNFTYLYSPEKNASIVYPINSITNDSYTTITTDFIGQFENLCQLKEKSIKPESSAVVSFPGIHGVKLRLK